MHTNKFRVSSGNALKIIEDVVSTNILKVPNLIHSTDFSRRVRIFYLFFSKISSIMEYGRNFQPKIVPYWFHQKKKKKKLFLILFLYLHRSVTNWGRGRSK